jgi:site-specific DNA recombinase
MPKRKRRAVGVVRVSRVGGREGERFVSPDEQRERIRAVCERDELELIDVLSELDVSGGAPLEQRPGLRRAVELVEAGEADVIVAAYFDRLVRSLQVQGELVSRVEHAGGAVHAVDVGQVTNGSSAQRLSGTMLGAVAEYQRRSTAERTADAKRRALERGVPPFPNIPPGYRRRDDRQLEPDPATAPVVAKAFELRARGETIKGVREYLREHGIERSFHGTQAMLASRIVLGELHFGELVNSSAHPPIVDADTWGRVQRMRLQRGRRAKSERLLARLSVLRCGTCSARMVIGSSSPQGGRTYALYRCPPVGDCRRRVTIGAELVEQFVTDKVRRLLAGISAQATSAAGAEEAAAELDRWQSQLDAAIRAFTGLEDEASARERLEELREGRDAARARLDELAAIAADAVVVDASRDWDLLTLDERRALIRAVVERVTVAPGRGVGRITVKPRSK